MVCNNTLHITNKSDKLSSITSTASREKKSVVNGHFAPTPYKISILLNTLQFDIFI